MGSLRVISGIAKGCRLHSVPGDITRPITDRTKESLFNIIGPDIKGAYFLDLFAGTGSVGIEALSRGADFVLFIDKHSLAIKTIRNNLRTTNLEKNAKVLKIDAFKYLKNFNGFLFDYIYIAPPQYKNMWINTLDELDKYDRWYSNDAWIMVQIDPIEYETTSLKNLNEFNNRKYGSTMLVFFNRKR